LYVIAFARFYEAAPTPTSGGGAYTSFDGWFYDK
jgi:hypothetical protein